MTEKNQNIEKMKGILIKYFAEISDASKKQTEHDFSEWMTIAESIAKDCLLEILYFQLKTNEVNDNE